jgi:hypothetical protein
MEVIGIDRPSYTRRYRESSCVMLSLAHQIAASLANMARAWQANRARGSPLLPTIQVSARAVLLQSAAPPSRAEAAGSIPLVGDPQRS